MNIIRPNTSGKMKTCVLTSDTLCQREKIEKTETIAAPSETKPMTKWNKPISHFKALNLINQLFLKEKMRKMMSDKWGGGQSGKIHEQETDTESGTETGSETRSSETKSEAGSSECSTGSKTTRSSKVFKKEKKVEKNAPPETEELSESCTGTGSETGSSEYTGSGSEYTDSEYDSETGSSNAGSSDPKQGAVGMFMQMQMRQMQQIGLGPKVPASNIPNPGLGPKVPASNLPNPQKNPDIEPKGKVELEKEASENSENESENSESEEESGGQESSSTNH